jgi:hypothetical protein
MKTPFFRVLAIVLFSIGVLFGVVFFAAATFADVEAVFYGFDRFGYKSTSAFYCPVMIASGESGVVRAVFENETETSIRPTVRFQTSSPSVFRTEIVRLEIGPGESQSLEWEIGQSDLAYSNLIFAKILTYASYPAPDVEQTCGVLVLDLPGLTGKQATMLVVAVSLAGMALGGGLWMASRPVKGRAREVWPAMLTLTVIVLAGMGSVLFALWPAGILLTAFSLVLIGVIVGHFIQTNSG